jgi:uncharacterized protein YggE
MNPIRIAAIAALVLAAAALAGVGRPEEARSEQGTPSRGITVTATGKLESVPDRASLEIGVDTQAPSAKEALAQNAQRIERVIEALRNAGAAKDDIRTSQVYLWPQRTSEETTVTGYQAQNTVSVELEVAEAGAAIDAAVAAGANIVSGPSLAIDDRDALYRKALASAVDAARAKAEAIARAAGVSVGRVTAVVESGDFSEPPMPYAAMAERAADTTVEPGKQTVEATVSVTFAVA